MHPDTKPPLPPGPIIDTSVSNRRKWKPAPKRFKKAAEPIVEEEEEEKGRKKEKLMLLAGYLAHEFLTRGTILGQVYREGDAAKGPASGEARMIAKEEEADEGSKEEEEEEERKVKKMNKNKYKVYVDVMNLLTGDDAAHLPGVFNPSQLAQHLKL